MPLSPSIMKLFTVTEAELLQKLDSDVSEIFATMVGMNLSPPAAQTDTVSKFNDCVTAMVGLAGPYNGLVSINTTRKMASTIASKMLGMEIVEFNEDVTDALGEIANMIGGSFKHHFVMDGHEVKLSTPSVITVEEYEISSAYLPDTLSLLFASEDELFTVGVYLETSE